MTGAATIDEVLALYERWGREHYDEDLSQTDHALQSAALAVAAGADDALVVAALLHDVGHLLDLEAMSNAPTPTAEAAPADTARHDPGTVSTDLLHETVGARYLATLFGPEVTGPVALHVRAKRYLAATDPAYVATLSEGSVRSLAAQGGPMDATEVATFASNPGFDGAIALRRWDDGGKIDGLLVAGFDEYRERLARLSTC